MSMTTVDLVGQELYLTTKLGALYYQGDLSPKSNKYSTSTARLGASVGLQYYLSKYVSMYGEVLVGTLVGDDMYAKDEHRRQRNLSFRSYLFDAGAGLKFSMSSIVGFFRKSGIDIEIFMGGNIFYFNPKTRYKGEWIALQPLATEGQGWVKGSQPKYSLVELSLSRGVDFSFRINKKIIVGIELVLKKTYTDYLDDVSTTYVNYDELVENSSVLAAELGNRMGEYNNTEPVKYETGTVLRGNSDKNDSYIFSSVTFSYKLYN